MYMRRLESETIGIAQDKFNPFKRLNYDKGWFVHASYASKQGCGEFYRQEKPEDEKDFVGYASALSVFGRLRGADLSDTDKMFFDEFVKAFNQPPLKNEADLFFNAYETINRNRELEGKPPLIVYCASNSTSFDTPIMHELGMLPELEFMRRNGQQYLTDKSRGVHVEILKDLKVSEAKKDTALYRATKGTQYSKHALDNEFAYDSFENIGKVNLVEYKPFIHLENANKTHLYIYEHKSRPEYYCCRVRGDCQYDFSGDRIKLYLVTIGSKMRFLINNGSMKFESFDVKTELLNYYPH